MKGNQKLIYIITFSQVKKAKRTYGEDFRRRWPESVKEGNQDT